MYGFGELFGITRAASAQEIVKERVEAVEGAFPILAGERGDEGVGGGEDAQAIVAFGGRALRDGGRQLGCEKGQRRSEFAETMQIGR